MAGLTPFATIQKTLSVLDPVDHRKVGWSIMRNLAVAQLRDGRSVVLDGVARDDEIATTRGTADLVLDAMNDLDANRRALVQLIGTREASELR